MAMSPDNRLLLLALWGGVREAPLKAEKIGRINRNSQLIELRSLADGKTITKTEVPGRGLGRPAFSPNGELVAIPVIDEPPRIELRRVPDLSEVGRIELPSMASRSRVVEFSHSGKLLAVPTADSNVLVWDLDHLPPKKSP
jgi:WD40 repeat protein